MAEYAYWDTMFSEYIKGKRVCFVGGGSCNMGRGLGTFIDSFDIVVRTNNAINLVQKPSYYKDFGSRVHILYVNNQFHRHARPLDIPGYITKGVVWLCTKMKQQKYLELYRSQKILARSPQVVMGEVNESCKSATMGNYIWADILKCGPKELYLTGVDFFASRKKIFEHDVYAEYIPGYLPAEIVAEGNIINAGKQMDGHDFYSNACYTYALAQGHKNFTMDADTRKLLIDIVNRRAEQR